MGTVWVAIDDKLGREVAVKVMAHGLVGHPELMARFEREAKAVAQLRSTHVVEVYDYGLHESLPFIVMELLEGESLRGRLRRLGRVPLRDTAIISDQIGKGLKAAHNAGLVHRDLKPSNVFIAVRDDVEIVKLLDFGVVKAIDSAGHTDMTASGTLLGTPQYMSPEQVRARRQVDPRSDLWSLGVIIFRMLTGINPFRGESVGDAALRICSDELPRVGDYCDDLPHELDGFFARAFARDPDRRFQSADELSAAFRSVCALVMAGGARPAATGTGAAPSTEALLPASPSQRGETPSARVGPRLPAPPIAAGATALAAAPAASATPPPMVRRLPNPVMGESHTPISVSGVVLPPAAPGSAGHVALPMPTAPSRGLTPVPGVAQGDTLNTRPAIPVSMSDDDSSGVHSSSSWNVATRKMPPLEERLAAARAAGVPLPAALAALAAADGAAPGAGGAPGSGSFSSPGVSAPSGTPSSLGMGAIPGTNIPLPGTGIEGPPSVIGTLSLQGDLRALRGRLLASPMALVIGVAATVFLGGILAVVMLTPDDPPEGGAPAPVITGRMFNPSWTRMTRPPGEEDGSADGTDLLGVPPTSAAPMGSTTAAPTTDPTQRGKTPGGSKPTKPRPKWF